MTETGSMAAVVAATREGWRAENRGAAQRLIACYEVLQNCIRQGETGLDDDGGPAHEAIDSFDVAVNYLLAAMPISALRAENMLVLADELHVRYPAVLAALTDGLLELRIATLMAAQMATVDPDILPVVQQQVVDDYLASLEGGERLGENTIRGRIDGIIGHHDPNAVRQRRQDAARDRGVRLRKGADGMTGLNAVLASEEAAILAEAIEQRVNEHTAAEADAHAAAVAAATAAGTPEPDDESEHYPIAQRRADALMSLTCGDTTTAEGREPAPLRPQVTVISTAPGTTSDMPGPVVEFTRTGQAALQALLDMLAASDGASLEHLDPRIGAADTTRGALTYRPGAQLARRIRLRDGTCRHPGCLVPADGCDIDHVRPFNHADPERGGHTVETNLMCLCRRHHRFKTFSDWTYLLKPDGTLVVLAPDGQMMLTRPAGPLGTYRQEQARTEARAWQTQQRRSPDPTITD
ncbi:MAG: HNH endonuclease, partial [Nocardioidaceae bacterium]|nr:HNH endonuclease [Nocardioidaceae bacterium]